MSPLESYRAWAEMLIHFMAQKSKEDAVETFRLKDTERFALLTENTCYISQFCLALHPIEFPALERREFAGSLHSHFMEYVHPLQEACDATETKEPSSDWEKRIHNAKTLIRGQKPRSLAQALTEEDVLRKDAIKSIHNRLQHLVHLKLDEIEEPDQWFFDNSMNPYPFKDGKLRVPIGYGDRYDWAHDTLNSNLIDLPQTDDAINRSEFGDIALPQPMILTNEAGYKCVFDRNHGFVGRDDFIYLAKLHDNRKNTHDGYLGLTEADHTQLPKGMTYIYDETATAPLTKDAHFISHARGYRGALYTLKPSAKGTDGQLLALYKNGTECLTECEFQNAYSWYGGYWLQGISGNWGYYSLTSGWLHQPIFDEVPTHMPPHYLAHTDGRAGVLHNDTYELMLPCTYTDVQFVPPYGRGRGMEGYFVAEDTEGKYTLFDNEGQQLLQPLALGEVPTALQGQVEERLVYTKGETHEEQVRFWLRDLDHFSYLLSRK